MIKTIKITTKEINTGFNVCKSYLARHCQAWGEGLNIFVPLEPALAYFKDKEHLTGFLTHTPDSPVEIKGVYKDETKIPTFNYAEQLFGKEVS